MSGKTRTRRVDELASVWMEDPKFRAEYEALEEEFTLADAMIDARARAELTQDQVAKRMKTSQTYVASIEGGRGNPSVKTLRRFAAATGTRLKISFEPDRKRRAKAVRRETA